MNVRGLGERDAAIILELPRRFAVDPCAARRLVKRGLAYRDGRPLIGWQGELWPLVKAAGAESAVRASLARAGDGRKKTISAWLRRLSWWH